MTRDWRCKGCAEGVKHSLHYADELPVFRMATGGHAEGFGAQKPAVFIQCFHQYPVQQADVLLCDRAAWWNDQRISDSDFAKKAAADGWTIKPTRCPEHAQSG